MRRFYQQAGEEGGGHPGSGHPDANSHIDGTFGDLSTSERPDLAVMEQGTETPQTPPAEPQPPAAPPQEAPAPGDETQETPPAQETAPGGEPKEGVTDTATPPTDGTLESIPVPKDLNVDRILGKYNGNPESIATALKGALNWQGDTAKQRDELVQRVGNLESFERQAMKYLQVDQQGRVSLRPEANGYRQPAQSLPDPNSVDPNTVRQFVERKFRENYSEIMDEDQLDLFMQQSQPMIEEMTRDEVQRQRTQAESARMAITTQTGQIMERHYAQFPQHRKELKEEIDRFYDSFPNPYRAIIDGYAGGFSKVCQLLALEKNLGTMAKALYSQGWKDREKAVKPSEAAPPGTGGARRPQAGKDGQIDQSFKDRMLGGKGLPEGMPPIETEGLFGK